MKHVLNIIKYTVLLCVFLSASSFAYSEEEDSSTTTKEWNNDWNYIVD